MSTAAPSRNRATWLILAHCFNMDGRAASQTITDRLPGLLGAGVRPVVVSAPTGVRDQRFPHYQVYSASPSCFLFEIRHVLNRKVRSRPLRQTLKGLITLLLLPLYIPEKIFIHLDSQWAWFISATLRSWFLVLKYRPALVYSTAGPPSTHLAAYLVAKTNRLPWLAEIHDPLSYDWQQKRNQNDRFKSWLEGVISRHADAVIYFTEASLAKAKGRHSFKGKTMVLRPGAAPPDFTRVRYLPSDKLHIGHFGSLGADRNLAMVFAAIHELITENPAWREFLALDIYGADLDPLSSEALQRYPLAGIVNLHGRLEYDPASGKSGRQRVLEAMRQSDILLLLHGTDAYAAEYIPSKLYEYLQMRRPVLGLVGPNPELRAMLTDLGHRAIMENDPVALKTALARLINTWQQHGLADTTLPSPFTVNATVSALTKVAEEISST